VLFEYDDAALFQIRFNGQKIVPQQGQLLLWPPFRPSAKQDHRRLIATLPCKQGTKVGVSRDEDTSLF